VQEALDYFRKDLKISERLAQADPTDAQAQRDLIISHAKFGLTHRQLLEYASSVASFQSGLKIATAVQERGLLKGNIERLIQSLKRDIAKSRTLQVATGDWETVLEQAAKSPVLLYHRAAAFAKQKKFDEAAQAAAKYREIAQAVTEGKADQLYNAARAYGLCAAAVQPAEGETLTEAEQTRRTGYLDLSLACLKEAIAAGYDDFAHARKDSDLTALRDLPEFQKLVKANLKKPN
jgi:tetratricopeptide (TPR) repeat protein